MVSIEQRRKLAAAVLVIVGGALAAFSWLAIGSDAVIYVVLGLLIAVIGLTVWRGKNKQVSYAFFATGISTLLMAAGRASLYRPTNELVIALIILSAVTFFRGYQYLRAGINTSGRAR